MRISVIKRCQPDSATGAGIYRVCDCLACSCCGHRVFGWGAVACIRVVNQLLLSKPALRLSTGRKSRVES